MKLEVRHAYCGYKEKEPVLKDVGLSVEGGEICCILGPNGVGKTTLFKSILGLLKLLCGEVLIDGEDTSRWTVKKRSKVMAYVAQSHVPPFPYRVKDVVLLGRIAHIGYFGQPSGYDYEVAEEIMCNMGIDHLRDREYTDISGGERQLIMIARALVQEPDFLILDEPTANLDFGNAIKVIKQLNALKKKKLGIIMTTHSPDHVFLCNSKVVLLTREKTLIYGEANDVITEKNLQAAYGLKVKVMGYFDEKGRHIKVCSPVMD